MASLMQELQDLLKEERAQVEAVRLFEEDIEEIDPEIADGLRDVEEAATWACRGLYHRITQLGSTPTLLTGNLPERLMEKPELRDRIRVLCTDQHETKRHVSEMLKRDDLDVPTKEFLVETKRLHTQAITWCESVLSQWKHETYAPPPL